MANAQYSLFVACYYKAIFINGWEEQWRYEIKVDYRQRIAWQEQALTWCLKDKKASTEALVYTLNRMRDAYSDALEERDVECDSARKAY